MEKNSDFNAQIYNGLLLSVSEEVDRIREEHNFFNSAHELWGVLDEEFNIGFKNSVHQNNPSSHELIQIALH